MSRADDDDDEALTWAGGRDPSHYETPGAKAAQPARASKSSAASGSSKAGTVDGETSDEPDERPSMSGIVLVCLGVLGGIYALYTVGWFVSWRRLSYVDSDALELTAFRVQQVLTIVVPALWFGATVFFTRGRRTTSRLLWLVLGALLLIPWSFVFGN